MDRVQWLREATHAGNSSHGLVDRGPIPADLSSPECDLGGMRIGALFPRHSHQEESPGGVSPDVLWPSCTDRRSTGRAVELLRCERVERIPSPGLRLPGRERRRGRRAGGPTRGQILAPFRPAVRGRFLHLRSGFYRPMRGFLFTAAAEAFSPRMGIRRCSAAEAPVSREHLHRRLAEGRLRQGLSSCSLRCSDRRRRIHLDHDADLTPGTPHERTGASATLPSGPSSCAALAEVPVLGPIGPRARPRRREPATSGSVRLPHPPLRLPCGPP